MYRCIISIYSTTPHFSSAFYSTELPGRATEGRTGPLTAGRIFLPHQVRDSAREAQSAGDPHSEARTEKALRRQP
jgi:hypothetical protein